MLVYDTDKTTHLKKRFSQKLVLIQSLLKLRFMDYMGDLPEGVDVDKLLKTTGLAVHEDFVVDMRPYVPADKFYGSCFSNLFEEFILKADTTVQEYIDIFTQRLKQHVSKEES